MGGEARGQPGEAGPGGQWEVTEGSRQEGCSDEIPQAPAWRTGSGCQEGKQADW